MAPFNQGPGPPGCHNGCVLDRLKIFSAPLRRLLADDEHAVALQATAYLVGEEVLDAERPRLDADTALDLALGLPTYYVQRVVDRMVSGTSLWGWPGCLAASLRDGLDLVGADLLLTDRRLLVVKHTGQQDFTIGWDHPRSDVLTLQRASRFGQAGRLWLTMADGSALALIMGYATAGAAKRFVAAWGTISGDPGSISTRPADG